MQSALEPTSSNTDCPPLMVGKVEVIHGRITPGMVLSLYMDPTRIAPVLPLLANTSMRPLASISNPTAIELFGFLGSARVG